MATVKATIDGDYGGHVTNGGVKRRRFLKCKCGVCVGTEQARCGYACTCGRASITAREVASCSGARDRCGTGCGDAQVARRERMCGSQLEGSDGD
jgi:hypothetical protein